MRALWITLIAGGVDIIFGLHATTLEQLSLNEMTHQSTAIERARVIRSSGLRKGDDVYTVYKLQLIEVWKPAGKQSLTEVAVPGGVAGGVRQVVPGAPILRPGYEYVIFMWTSRSGLTQITGLSQGLFTVNRNPAGNLTANRAAASERMLDTLGHQVRDEAVSIKLSDLKSQVASALWEAK